MNPELKKAFDILDINTKRNQISDELILIGELIKNYEKSYNVESMLQIKNYNQAKDQTLKESEMLTFLYEDIYNIEQELLTLLTIINHQEN